MLGYGTMYIVYHTIKGEYNVNFVLRYIYRQYMCEVEKIMCVPPKLIIFVGITLIIVLYFVIGLYYIEPKSGASNTAQKSLMYLIIEFYVSLPF